MRFSEMPYKRPNIRTMARKLNSLSDKLNNAQNFAEADALMLEAYREIGHYDTMFALAQIRHNANTEDDGYRAEASFFELAETGMERTVCKLEHAITSSRFTTQFAEKYGPQFLPRLENDQRQYSHRVNSDLRREKKLVVKYRMLRESEETEAGGMSIHTADIVLTPADRKDSARNTVKNARLQTNPSNDKTGKKLDSVFDSLVRQRTKTAKKLGFVSFTDLGYCRMNRESWGKDEAQQFRDKVTQYAVPLAKRIVTKADLKKAHGSPIEFADSAMVSKTVHTDCSAETLFRQLRLISPEMEEFVGLVCACGLKDIGSRSNKAAGGFCVTMPDYESPFIFANCSDTVADLWQLAHETGHAFAAYASRKIRPSVIRTATPDAEELHAAAMEFFAASLLEQQTLEENKKMYVALRMADAICFLPYGAMVDDFQHQVYAKPELSSEERNEIWTQLARDYMPWLEIDSKLPYVRSSWHLQGHLYEEPFYYIDYCFALTAAMEMFESADTPKLWNNYMKFVRSGGTATFAQMVERLELHMPSEALCGVCLDAEKKLSIAGLV